MTETSRDTETTSEAADAFDLDRFSRTLIERGPDAVLYAGRDGRIVYWNAGAERIFGFTAADALGQPLDIIIPENLRKRHGEGFDETMRTGKTRYGAGDLLSVPALRKDGARISVEFSIMPVLDEDGHIAGIAAVLRDVSKNFEAMRALRLKIKELSAG